MTLCVFNSVAKEVVFIDARWSFYFMLLFLLQGNTSFEVQASKEGSDEVSQANLYHYIGTEINLYLEP